MALGSDAAATGISGPSLEPPRPKEQGSAAASGSGTRGLVGITPLSAAGPHRQSSGGAGHPCGAGARPGGRTRSPE